MVNDPVFNELMNGVFEETIEEFQEQQLETLAVDVVEEVLDEIPRMIEHPESVHFVAFNEPIEHPESVHFVAFNEQIEHPDSV